MSYVCSGYDAFVTKNVTKDEFILEYAGELIEPNEFDCSADDTYVYFFQLGKHYHG